MSGKATVSAPANIAFIKYWGASDLASGVPVNRSISMTLTRCRSTTTVEAVGGPDDEVLLATGGAVGAEPATGGSAPFDLEPAPESFAAPVRRHLGRLRDELGHRGAFRVATVNSFPAAAGLASSASGFAALAGAVTAALGAEIAPHRLSELARLSGSGSAARSVLGGFVEWPARRPADGPPGGDVPTGAAPTDDALAPRQLAPAAHWPLADVIALVETEPKEVSSRQGHTRAPTSPHFARRLELIEQRLPAVRRAIAERDLAVLGPMLEEEAIELHLIAMSSRPPIFYWSPATVAVLAAVRELRRGGVAAYSTMDAGANVHVLCEPADEEAVADRLGSVDGVVGVLRDRAGDGPAPAEPLF